MAFKWGASQQTAGGGGWEGGIGTIESARCVRFDYGGNAKEVPAIQLVIRPDNGTTPADETVTEHWSAGKLEKLRPSDDGETFEPAPGSAQEALNENSKAGKLMASLDDAGFNTEEMAKASDLVGVRAAFERVPYKSGVVREGAKEDGNVLIVKRTLDALGAKPAKAGKVTQMPAKAPAKGAAGANGLQTKADEAIVTLLESQSPIPVGKLSTMVFKALKSDPDVRKITALVQEEDFLGREDAPFDYDGDHVVKQ